MKKIFLLLIALIMMGAILTTTVSAASTAASTPTPELGQLKICKVAGSGVTQGQLFTFKVGGNSFNVPAGPAESGYCVLAGQYPLDTQLTIEEVIPSGYYVWRIEVRPNRTLTKDIVQGTVVVKIGSGVTEVIFTNDAIGAPTATPRPTQTGPAPTSSSPTGRLQICKEADGEGVSGYFTFRFETRSRSIPVGACAGLISVPAGRLTVTEVAQAGYEVTDIYTIPANRLISKNLHGGSATVTIVEGTASSQTIVVFRNRIVTTNVTPSHTPTPTSTGSITSTFTPTSTGSVTPTFTATPTGSSTPTFTPTSTGTITPTFTPTPTGSITPTATTPPSVCPPAVIFANFSGIQVGQSVEGLGAVAPFLNIDAAGTARKVLQATEPIVYFAANDSGNINGGLAGDGGFSDLVAKNAMQAHLYNFTFAPGVSITNFSLHMLDYGDLNPTLNTSHYVSMTAYDANGNVVSKEELSYTTLAESGPRTSSLYGDLFFNGDAVAAPPGQPGNWIWNVSGNGIVRVVLEFGAGFDPNIGFDLLSFNVVCQ